MYKKNIRYQKAQSAIEYLLIATAVVLAVSVTAIQSNFVSTLKQGFRTHVDKCTNKILGKE